MILPRNNEMALTVLDSGISIADIEIRPTPKQGEPTMAETSITKVNAESSPKGAMGQKYLAAGVSMAMRLWEDEQPGQEKAASERDYETVGYVIKGRAELHLGPQIVLLEPGDSWVVPRGASHSYRILEAFTAVEATHPPGFVHARDEKNG
jgi:mannose-6-phosphate isomerase-like protein (cupin superfamily)